MVLKRNLSAAGALVALALVQGCSAPPELASPMPSVAIIPRPQSLTLDPGTWEVGPATVVLDPVADSSVHAIRREVAVRLGAVTGVVPRLVPQSVETGSTILFALDSTLLPTLGMEGYRLAVDSSGVRAVAGAPHGLFHALQSFRQVLPAVPTRSVTLPCFRIEDRPRFSWRGMHLDVSRHFFGVAFIKRYLDVLALHKMNVFHWHLTDDNGWRIEIKKYPRLAGVAAWRVDREAFPWMERKPQQPGEPATYGGCFTQEQVREVVRYAAARHITVVPEIEMPAHAVAALSAYPEFSCTGGPFTVPPGSYWPNIDIYCAGREETFRFLGDVLDEVADLFPGPFIHVGGDEADKTNWKKCPRCQERMRTEHLKNEDELQSYFIRRIEGMLEARGKRLIGWDEILQGGLPPGATVMSWRGMEGGIEAATQGHDVVMTPTGYCYFDYYQAKEGEPKAIGGFVPLETVYGFDPMPPSLPSAQQRHILGTQGNLWTEYIPTEAHAEYMALPRLSALAETAWSDPSVKDYPDFLRRFTSLSRHLDAMGVHYRPLDPAR